MEIIVRSRLKTSTAKIMAAIGDWKIEAIAPAEAQAIRRDRVLALICNNLATLELIAAPEATAGPKSPTEPPKPPLTAQLPKAKIFSLHLLALSFLTKQKEQRK